MKAIISWLRNLFSAPPEDRAYYLAAASGKIVFKNGPPPLEHTFEAVGFSKHEAEENLVEIIVLNPDFQVCEFHKTIRKEVE